MLSLNEEAGESAIYPAKGGKPFFVNAYVEGPAGHPSGIKPTEFKVLVLPDPVEEKTKGGIILIDDTKERKEYAAQKATLVAVSPAAFSYDEDVRKNAPRPGERVLVAKYSGFEVEGADGVKYRVVADKDICAILT